MVPLPWIHTLLSPGRQHDWYICVESADKIDEINFQQNQEQQNLEMAHCSIDWIAADPY